MNDHVEPVCASLCPGLDFCYSKLGLYMIFSPKQLRRQTQSSYRVRSCRWYGIILPCSFMQMVWRTHSADREACCRIRTRRRADPTPSSTVCRLASRRYSKTRPWSPSRAPATLTSSTSNWYKRVQYWLGHVLESPGFGVGLRIMALTTFHRL